MDQHLRPLGQVVSRTDPTAGTSYSAYDADGNLLQTQDSRGKYVSYTYDALDRKTGQYAAATADQTAYTSTSSPGNQTAAWVYDNANTAVSGMTYPIGHVTTATSYSGGYAYTQQAVGFNVFGESLGEQTVIPSAAQGRSSAGRGRSRTPTPVSTGCCGPTGTPSAVACPPRQ